MLFWYCHGDVWSDCSPRFLMVTWLAPLSGEAMLELCFFLIIPFVLGFYKEGRRVNDLDPTAGSGGSASYVRSLRVMVTDKQHKVIRYDEKMT